MHEDRHSYKMRLRDMAPELEKFTNDERILNLQVKLCACGLSKTKPICDESHHQIQTEEPGKVYVYDSELHGRALENEYPERQRPPPPPNV